MIVTKCSSAKAASRSCTWRTRLRMTWARQPWAWTRTQLAFFPSLWGLSMPRVPVPAVPPPQVSYIIIIIRLLSRICRWWLGKTIIATVVVLHRRRLRTATRCFHHTRWLLLRSKFRKSKIKRWRCRCLSAWRQLWLNRPKSRSATPPPRNNSCSSAREWCCSKFHPTGSKSLARHPWSRI